MSIPSNIAEGCGRGIDADFKRFLQVAIGSASEVEYQILLASDLGYLELAQLESQLAKVREIKRMLTSLMKRLMADR